VVGNFFVRKYEVDDAALEEVFGDLDADGECAAMQFLINLALPV